MMTITITATITIKKNEVHVNVKTDKDNKLFKQKTSNQFDFIYSKHDFVTNQYKFVNYLKDKILSEINYIEKKQLELFQYNSETGELMPK